MFSTSTHKRHWLFADPCELKAKRAETNERYIKQATEMLQKADVFNSDIFMTPSEERSVCFVVEETAQKFCRSFVPPMPPAVVAVAFAYFKRFYLNNSVMEHVAKSVMMGCMYLACKVEEFNVSIDEFVSNMRSGSKEENIETILFYELELMYNLNYQLTVHTPYRAFEGFMIDLKTRYPSLGDAEKLRGVADEFLWHSLRSDASLLYPPSQVALAALKKSSDINGVMLDNYFELLAEGSHFCDALQHRLDDIIFLVSRINTVAPKHPDALMEKLRHCIQTVTSAHRLSQKRKSDNFGDAPDAKHTRGE